MERKLAHIEKIEWIKEIEGADKIELCGVLGWQCVIAKKDNFQVGDTVIYCEVDSVMPEKPEFEFLRDRKFRIRTIKLKGQVSQGLVLPISMLNKKVNIGDDVTDLLGITKYLSPSELDEIQQQERNIKLEKNRLKKYLMRYSFFRKLFLSKKQKDGKRDEYATIKPASFIIHKEMAIQEMVHPMKDTIDTLMNDFRGHFKGGENI